MLQLELASVSCVGCKQVFHSGAKLSRSSADSYSNSCMCDLSQVLSYKHVTQNVALANDDDA